MVTSPVTITTSAPGAPVAEQSGGCGCGGCGCGGGGGRAEAPAEARMEAGTTTVYAVDGMTCGHCVGAVTQELSALDGVESVDVTLVAGGTSTVTVRSAAPLDAEAVRAAIDEAGYALVGRA